MVKTFYCIWTEREMAAKVTEVKEKCLQQSRERDRKAAEERFATTEAASRLHRTGRTVHATMIPIGHVTQRG